MCISLCNCISLNRIRAMYESMPVADKWKSVINQSIYSSYTDTSEASWCWLKREMKHRWRNSCLTVSTAVHPSVWGSGGETETTKGGNRALIWQMGWGGGGRLWWTTVNHMDVGGAGGVGQSARARRRLKAPEHHWYIYRASVTPVKWDCLQRAQRYSHWQQIQKYLLL